MPNQNTINYLLRKGIDLSGNAVSLSGSQADSPTPGGWPDIESARFFPTFFNGGEITIPLTDLRTWDSPAANSPAAATSDDLGLIAGTFLTSAPTVQTSDGKATSVTQKARFKFPLNFDITAIQSLKVRINAGMLTTISDTTATVDVQMVREAAPTTDLITTAATSINSLTAADKDFTATITALAAGDILDCVVTIAIVDAATATAVIGKINTISLVIT